MFLRHYNLMLHFTYKLSLYRGLGGNTMQCLIALDADAYNVLLGYKYSSASAG